LNLSNRPENVVLVRQALSGLGETIGLDAIELNDMSTAVSEACNNVVMHAYDGDEGPMEVEVYAADEPEVIVRDSGGGIHPRPKEPDELVVGGIGLPVIKALSDSVEFRDLDGHGTEVRMRFAPANAHGLDAPSDDRSIEPGRGDGALDDSMAIAVGPSSLAQAVLPRIMCALAARAQFSTDRISDTEMVADAIVAHAPESISADRLSVQIGLMPRNLRLRIGPFLSGHGERVFNDAAAEGLASVLEQLSDGHEISRAGGGDEVLDLQLVERDAKR
jgi:serine/threonine-protein kinase RsbW